MIPLCCCVFRTTLVSNALGYAKSRVDLTLRGDARFVYLIVEDDGRGFTPEELTQATKAFYKDKSHENSAHFGLGLNICQTLCGRHGGWLSLENNPHGGRQSYRALFPCGFRFPFPLRKGEKFQETWDSSSVLSQFIL